MKLWLILIAIAMLVAPTAFAHTGADSSAPNIATASADGEVDEVEAIAALLAHYHKIPDRRHLESVSDDARQIIFDISRDDEAGPFFQRRAMKALVNWPDAETFEYLTDVLNDETTDDGLRHHLLLVLANGYGEEALDTIKPYLFEASDPHLRISAGNAVSQIPGDRAYEMLTQALRAEQNPIVQSRLEQFAPRLR